MGMALMVGSGAGALVASGQEFNIFGWNITSGTESATQASATEGATFSNLRARVISDNSGTATFQFRDAGANGNENTQITGVGSNEDSTNTDVLTAGDLSNIAYTDTGTDSGIGWVACNLSLLSGHGAFHGCANFGGNVQDVQSATRFHALGGILLNDGTATEANAQSRIRGYDSFEALQVRVTANARTNNSVFRNRINTADGTGVITFGSGITGLLTATGLADSIADGQPINASITLDTGVQDLTLVFIGATLKSSTSKQDIWAQITTGLARTAGATAHYVPIGGRLGTLTAFTEAQARIKPGFAGVVSNLRAYCSANTYTGNGTLKLYQNGVAVITTTITASGGAGWYENAVTEVNFDADDEFSYELDEGTSGSATFHMIGMTFAPTGGEVAVPMRALMGVGT